MWMSTKIPTMLNTNWSNSWLLALKISVLLGMRTSLFMAGGGADMQNILDFEKDYKEAKVVLLEENYRSTKTILQAANDVIKTIATAVRRISGHKMKTGKRLSITGLMTSRMKQSLLLKRLKS